MIPINSLEQVMLGQEVLNQAKWRSFDPSCAHNCKKAQNTVARSPQQPEIRSWAVGESRVRDFATPCLNQLSVACTHSQFPTAQQAQGSGDWINNEAMAGSKTGDWGAKRASVFEVGQPHLPASPLSKGSSCKEPGSVAGFFPSNTLTEWTHVILGTCKVHLPNSTNRALD